MIESAKVISGGESTIIMSYSLLKLFLKVFIPLESEISVGFGGIWGCLKTRIENKKEFKYIWVKKEHPVRFIREFVESINLREYGFVEKKSEEGRPNYSNKLLIKIWLYCYYEKIYSSWQIERACMNQLPLIWLITMHYPDHNTIWRFLRRIKESYTHSKNSST